MSDKILDGMMGDGGLSGFASVVKSVPHLRTAVEASVARVRRKVGDAHQAVMYLLGDEPFREIRDEVVGLWAKAAGHPREKFPWRDDHVRRVWYGVNSATR